MKIIDWNEYEELLAELKEQIIFSKFDDIIAIGRGGSIIASYLALKLGVPTFYPIFLRHVGKGGEKRIEGGRSDVQDRIRSLEGRLLIVDDYLRDGLAMKHMLNLTSKKAVKKTLVMYVQKDSEFKPDFVGKYIEEPELMFPYSTLG